MTFFVMFRISEPTICAFFHIIILRNNERKGILRQHHQKWFWYTILYSCTVLPFGSGMISLPILWNQLKQCGIRSFHLNEDVCYIRGQFSSMRTKNSTLVDSLWPDDHRPTVWWFMLWNNHKTLKIGKNAQTENPLKQITNEKRSIECV